MAQLVVMLGAELAEDARQAVEAAQSHYEATPGETGEAEPPTDGAA